MNIEKSTDQDPDIPVYAIDHYEPWEISLFASIPPRRLMSYLNSARKSILNDRAVNDDDMDVILEEPYSRKLNHESLLATSLVLRMATPAGSGNRYYKIHHRIWDLEPHASSRRTNPILAFGQTLMSRSIDQQADWNCLEFMICLRSLYRQQYFQSLNGVLGAINRGLLVKHPLLLEQAIEFVEALLPGFGELPSKDIQLFTIAELVDLTLQYELSEPARLTSFEIIKAKGDYWTLRKLTNTSQYSMSPEVTTYVQEAISVIKARIEVDKLRSTLLRPSSNIADGSTLLRPARGSGNDIGLLRPVDCIQINID